MVHVVVAGGWRVSAQRELVARHRAAHAQAGVGVDVVGAQQAFGQLVEDVIVLGQQLAADIDAQCVGPVLAHDGAQLVSCQVERGIPAQRGGRATALQALQGLQQARMPVDVCRGRLG